MYSFFFPSVAVATQGKIGIQSTLRNERVSSVHVPLREGAKRADVRECVGGCGADSVARPKLERLLLAQMNRLAFANDLEDLVRREVESVGVEVGR